MKIWVNNTFRQVINICSSRISYIVSQVIISNLISIEVHNQLFELLTCQQKLCIIHHHYLNTYSSISNESDDSIHIFLFINHRSFRVKEWGVEDVQPMPDSFGITSCHCLGVFTDKTQWWSVLYGWQKVSNVMSCYEILCHYHSFIIMIVSFIIQLF